MNVSREVFSIFLVDTFINNSSGRVIPEILVQKLQKYEDVGKIVYYQPRNKKAPPGKYINARVLQIIVSTLVRIILDETSKYYCALILKDSIIVPR